MRVRLEVFRTDPAPGPAGSADGTIVTDAAALEEARLAAYEQGYAAGWDDAVAAAEGERNRLAADLGRHLQELSFTYHEARTHVLAALEPLVVAMTGQVLPALAREALGAVVLETLRPQARDAALVPLRLTVHPAARAAVEAALLAEATLPVEIAEDPGLAETAAGLAFGESGRSIDLDAAVARIAAAARDFFRLELDGPGADPAAPAVPPPSPDTAR